MKKNDIHVGKTYEIRHHKGHIHTVRVLRTKEVRLAYGRYDIRTMTHYVCLKLSTGQEIEVRSAAKFRREVTQ